MASSLIVYVIHFTILARSPAGTGEVQQPGKETLVLVQQDERDGQETRNPRAYLEVFKNRDLCLKTGDKILKNYRKNRDQNRKSGIRTESERYDLQFSCLKQDVVISVPNYL